MKVYVVIGGIDYEFEEILGIFVSPKKAEDLKESEPPVRLRGDDKYDYYYVSDYELDMEFE